MGKNVTIFLSYAWKNKDIADQIDETLNTFEVSVTRDVRDLKHLDDIFDFMKGIRSHDYAILVISEEYLTSKNCMFEALELIIDEKYDEKLLPVLTPSCDIFSAKGRLKYIQFWESVFAEINGEIKNLDSVAHTHKILEELEHYRKIRDNIDQFIGKIASIKGFNLSEIESIVECINVKKREVVFEEEDKIQQKNEIQTFFEHFWGNKFDPIELSSTYLSLLEIWRQQHTSDKAVDISLFVKTCNHLASLYTKKVKSSCHVSMKVILHNDGNNLIKTLARNIGSLREEFFMDVNQNTAFKVILSEKHKNRYFLCNDLYKLSEKAQYYNSNQNWQLYYKSTIVVPICQHINKDQMFIVGFLSVDSSKTNIFEEYDGEFLQGIGEYLHHPIILHSEKISKKSNKSLHADVDSASLHPHR